MASRRQFLRTTLAGSSVISLSAAAPSFLLGASGKFSQDKQDNILVVLQLEGGNDGLNTVIPFGHDEYYANRFTLAIDKNSVLKIDDEIGLNPAMGGMKKLLDDGRLGIVQGVGYPNPNRSHFESMDLWHTAHRAEDKQLGWLGRVLEGLPDDADLPAIHFGGGLQPLALRNRTRPAPSVRSIENFQLAVLKRGKNRAALKKLIAEPRVGENDLLGYVQRSAGVALATSEKLEKIVDAKKRTGGFPGSALGRNMEAIAKLIGSGLSTRIYYTSLGGFDTHSNQLAGHRGLLADFSQSMEAFINEMNEQGNGKRVTVMAFSEFGRRVRENASAGTDHGAAGPLILAGNSVKAGLLTEHPSLSRLDNGDLKFTVDYRRVYRELLDSWMGIDSVEVLGEDFDSISLFD